MWSFTHYCAFLLVVAATEAVDFYRGADNRVAGADPSVGPEYTYQPWPTDQSDADQANYIEKTAQHYPPVTSDRPPVFSRSLRHRSSTGLYRTSQRGSVHIPYRGAVVPVPVASGRNKPYRGVITTTVLSPGQTNADQNSVGMPARDASRREGVCVRCPADKTVVASRGLDHVLMERSKLRRCRRRPKVPGAKFDILYGPRPASVLTEGIHKVMGRVIYKRSELMRCQYSYKVIVRKCAPLMLPGFLEARCSLGNMWGSRCNLSCRQGYQLLGDDYIECGGDLLWTGVLPACKAEMSCSVPMSPDHGRLSCQAGPGDSLGDQLPEGSVCRYECDQGFEVPAAQTHLLVTSCRAGQWNNTVDASCLPLLDDEARRQLADTPAVIGEFQSDSIRHTVRLRHRKNRHMVTQRPAADSCWPNPCQAGGTCLAGPRHEPVLCVCPGYREGEFCEREACRKGICKNGGKCLMHGTELTCYCRQGYSGNYCEIQELG